MRVAGGVGLAYRSRTGSPFRVTPHGPPKRNPCCANEKGRFGATLKLRLLPGRQSRVPKHRRKYRGSNQVVKHALFSTWNGRHFVGGYFNHSGMGFPDRINKSCFSDLVKELSAFVTNFPSADMPAIKAFSGHLHIKLKDSSCSHFEGFP